MFCETFSRSFRLFSSLSLSLSLLHYALVLFAGVLPVARGARPSVNAEHGLDLGSRNDSQAITSQPLDRLSLVHPVLKCGGRDDLTLARYHNKVAILIRGESFQSYGRQRIKGLAADPSMQLQATNSQVHHLILPLENLGFAVDVFSVTYKTRFHYLLTNSFGTRLRVDLSLPKSNLNLSSQKSQWRSIDALTKAFYDYAAKNGWPYSFMVMLRHDTHFKMDMPHLPAFNSTPTAMVLVSFRDSIGAHCKTYPDCYPDQLQVMSMDVFGCLMTMLREADGSWMNESWLSALAGQAGGYDHLNVQTLVDWNATGSPSWSGNPLYNNLDRPEGRIEPENYFELCKRYLHHAMLLSVVLCCVGLPFGFLGRSSHYSAVYLILSVAIDLGVAFQKQTDTASVNALQSFKFDPACAVTLVEAGKWCISLLLVLRTSEVRRSPSELFSKADMKWFGGTALLYNAYNVLVFAALGGSDIASFGLFRDSAVVWTAILRKLLMRAELGQTRVCAIGVIVLGMCLHLLVSVRRGLHLSWGLSWVLCMTFVNALASVCNEKALKSSTDLDINEQNIVLYSLQVPLCIITLALWHPLHLLSPFEFFKGFTWSTCLVAVLQIFCGVCVSRLLRYTDALTKIVTACLRGPTLALIGPFLLGSQQAHLIPFGIVAVGCFVFLREGPLREPPSDAADKKE
eukprot:TRINITY_DN13332_c0_g1_i4.p1 TRINITY_DN13332_c0_g1~~TRINITY_DN13332_c0_g1_i4.p1  ORF type:complete len:684 (+),score=41.54 TRINITY_DN13332_c0_g1_i4:74-2125(+)